MDSLFHSLFTSLHFTFFHNKGLKEIPFNLTSINFDPKNEITFKLTRKSLLNAARARLARVFFAGKSLVKIQNSPSILQENPF